MGEPSDPAAALEALGAGALRGPAERAWELFDGAWPEIMRRLDAFERSLGVPRDSLEDCGQAVLLRVWRFRTSYRGNSAAELAGWMHAICRNEAARYAERTGRAPLAEASLSRGSEDSGAGPVEQAASPHGDDPADDPTGDAAAAADERRALEECLERLEPRHQEVVELIYGAEESTERAAAELLGRSKSYVGDLRRAGLELLAQCLRSKGID